MTSEFCSSALLSALYKENVFYKGQLISKCLYEIIVWTKIPTKFLIISALALSGQKLSNFLLVFWSKRRLQKDILKLTDFIYLCMKCALTKLFNDFKFLLYRLHEKHPWYTEQLSFLLLNTDNNKFLTKDELLEACKISDDISVLNFR